MAQNIVASFKYLKYGIGTVFVSQVLYAKYIDSTFYSNFYESLLSKFNPTTINEIHKKLLTMNLFKKIDREKYEEQLNGKLNNIYLPNIVGLAGGYDSQGNCVENLFETGFGFIEIGSLNPQVDIDSELKDENQLIPSEGVVEYMNDIKNQSVYKAKAYLGTFKNNKNTNEQHQYPIGSNIVPNRETKMFNPYLSEVDFIQAASEMLSVSDYLVLNLQGPEIKGIKHLFTVDKLTEIISEIKKERIQQYALQSIFEYEDAEIQEKYEGKILRNKIYTSEIYGRTPVTNQLINPQIYLKLSTTQNKQLILDIAKNYKQMGVEGLVIVDQNTQNATQNLRQIRQLSEGNLPLISVGGIREPKDVIERVKNGANAVQICSQVYLKGPNYIEKFLQGLVEELKINNVLAIKQLQNIDIE